MRGADNCARTAQRRFLLWAEKREDGKTLGATEAAPEGRRLPLATLFVLGGANSGRRGVFLAHKGAALRIAVRASAGEVIDLRSRVGPDDGFARTMSLGLRLGGEFGASQDGRPAASSQCGPFLGFSRFGRGRRRRGCGRSGGGGGGGLSGPGSTFNYEVFLPLARVLDHRLVGAPLGFARLGGFLLSMAWRWPHDRCRESGDTRNEE